MIKFLIDYSLYVNVRGSCEGPKIDFKKGQILTDGKLTYCNGETCGFEYDNGNIDVGGAMREHIQVI